MNKGKGLYEIQDKKVEEIYREQNKNSEVVTYTLPATEIEKMFAGARKPEGKAPIRLNYDWPEQENISKKRLRTATVKADLMAGLSIEQICKKHKKHKRVISRMVTAIQKETGTNYRKSESIQEA